MRMQVRTSLMVTMALAIMGLAACDHYNCNSGATFGDSSCTSSGAGLGAGGTSGSATAAFIFLAEARGGGGSIQGYTLDTNTSPAAINTTANYTAPTIPSLDGGIGMVVAQKLYLYTAFATTQQIFGWTIGADGGLTTIAGTPLAAPYLINGFIPFGAQVIATNPAGTLLFIAAGIQNEVYVYNIGTGGALTAVAGSPFPVGITPGNLSTDGLGKYLYITETFSNHTGSEIAAFSIGSSGALTAVPGTPFAYPMWQVQGDPTGGFLIGTSGNSAASGFSGIDDDHLYVFSIGSTGAISPVSGSPFPTTNSPLNIAVQTNTGGNLVYSLGLEDSALAFNPVEGYTLGSSGTLTAVSGSPFTDAAVGDLGQFDQSGSLFFIYGGIEDNNTVVYNMAAFGLVSGAPTEDATTLFGGGFWVATDAP